MESLPAWVQGFLWGQFLFAKGIALFVIWVLLDYLFAKEPQIDKIGEWFLIVVLAFICSLPVISGILAWSVGLYWTPIGLRHGIQYLRKLPELRAEKRRREALEAERAAVQLERDLEEVRQLIGP
jgi:hypothetical protein